MRLTIGGPPGSGTTTIAGMIAKGFCLEHIYAGMIFREMAKERGLSLEEFSLIAERDGCFDNTVDKKLAEGAKENTITEGRMAAFVVEAPDIKIWLDAPLETRVSRISDREGRSVEKIREMTVKRQDSETQRYESYYGVDIYDLSQYDIVINTEKWNQEGVCAIVESAITHLVRATQE